MQYCSASEKECFAQLPAGAFSPTWLLSGAKLEEVTMLAQEVARPCKRQRFNAELQEMLVDLSSIAREVRGYWGL